MTYRRHDELETLAQSIRERRRLGADLSRTLELLARGPVPGRARAEATAALAELPAELWHAHPELAARSDEVGRNLLAALDEQSADVGPLAANTWRWLCRLRIARDGRPHIIAFGDRGPDRIYDVSDLDEISIGSAPECFVRLARAWVEPEHVRILDGYEVTELDPILPVSVNGKFLAGKTVLLRSGTLIRVGVVTLRYERAPLRAPGRSQREPWRSFRRRLADVLGGFEDILRRYE